MKTSAALAAAFLILMAPLACNATSETASASAGSATSPAAGSPSEANARAEAEAEAATVESGVEAGVEAAAPPAKVDATLGADWTSWRGGDRMAKAESFEAPAEWPEELVTKYRVEVGTGHSTPALVAGRLYVHARQGEEETLLCLDATTGEEIWRDSITVPYEMDPTATEHGKGPKASVTHVETAAGGRVVTFGIDGALACHDAATGKVVWRHLFKEGYPKPSPRYGVALTPLVVDGTVIAHVGGDEKGSLAAFDLDTGERQWAWEGDGPGYASPIVTEAGGKHQVITQTRSYAVGLSLADGQLLWKMEYKTNFDQNSVTPIVHGDHLILSGYHKGIAAHDLTKLGDEGPDETWSTSSAAMYMSSPLLEGDTLYGFSEKRRGQYFAMNVSDGELLWTGDRREGENAALVDAGDVVIALDTDAELVVFRQTPEDYEELARYEVSEKPVWAHPIVSGRTIFVKDETHLIRLEVPTTPASGEVAEPTNGG